MHFTIFIIIYASVIYGRDYVHITYKVGVYVRRNFLIRKNSSDT